MKLFGNKESSNHNGPEKKGRRTADSSRPLPPGTLAPHFCLPATSGQTRSLHDFNGQRLILAFYPADWSSVCSNQLTFYNEVLPMFAELNAQLVGISVDDIDTHRSFAEAHNLAFPLLADDDPQGAVARSYGVYDEDKGICQRALFVIDEEGIIRWSYVSPIKINPGAHGILQALESLESEKQKYGS